MKTQAPWDHLETECPHCGVAAVMIGRNSCVHESLALVRFFVCPSTKCSKVSLWKFNPSPPHCPSPLIPDTGGRAPAAAEVEKSIADDYNEACAILDRSPQMAAVLVRRILQTILQAKGGASARDTLERQIEHVVPSLNQAIADNLHHLRQLGNAGAHPWVDGNGDPVRPDSELVRFFLDVLVDLFEHYYVAPARALEKRQQVNNLLQKAGKKPLP